MPKTNITVFVHFSTVVRSSLGGGNVHSFIKNDLRRPVRKEKGAGFITVPSTDFFRLNLFGQEIVKNVLILSLEEKISWS